MIKHIALAACLALPLAAFAADEKKELTPQQQKMAACNKEAADKKLSGDARKSFMSDCLSAKHAPTQQEKMGLCNKEAAKKELKGDERKAFMSSCLKG